MSDIFNHQNQMIIRFPQELADQLNEYFDKGGDEPQLTIECDPTRQQQSSRISLQVSLNNEQYKATVVQLPTISSTFKTIDRINFFKSNDISEMIVVHQSPYDQIKDYEAEKIKSNHNGNEKIRKYLGESGVTDATENIRQRFFRKKAKIDHGLVGTVDEALDLIKSQFTKQDQKGGRKKKIE